MEKIDKDKPDQPNDQLRFYKSYFIDYWIVKFKFLKHNIENFKTFKEKLSEISGLEGIPNYEKKYLSALKFDLHFMKFQIIETLFSFIFALENGDDINLWFNLSFPKETSLRSFAVYDKISGLNDKNKMETFLKKNLELDGNLISLLDYLFFFKIDLSEKLDNKNTIEGNIVTLLYQLASIFSDRDDYSAYKHSLRCYGSSLALSIRPQGANQFVPLGFARDGMIYLSKKEKEENIIVNVTFKAFSVEEDSYYIEKSIELLKNILNTRISHFFNEELGDISFFEDINQTFKEDYTIPGFSRSTTSRNFLFTKGLYAVKQNAFQDAITFFEKVLQIDKSHYETIFQMGYCYFSLGNFDEAITYFKLYIKNSVAEHWKYALYNLALCYFKKGDCTNAEKILKQCLNKYSNIEDKLTTAARYLLTEILLSLNQQYFNQRGKNKSNYIKRVEKLLEDAERFEFSHPELWFKLAFIKDCFKRFEESKIIYEKLIEKYPNDSLNALLNLSIIYFNEGELKKAEELLEKAILLDTEKSNTWNIMASLKEKQGEMEGFYESCQKSLEYSSNDEEKKYALCNLGTYYFITEDFPKAIEYFERSLVIDKSLQLAFKGLLRSLLGLKKYEDVIEKTEDIEYTLDNVIILRIRAIALSGNKKKDESIKIINDLMSLDNDNTELSSFLNDTIGDIFRMHEEWEKAIEFYQKALEGIQDLEDKSSEIEEKINECKKIKRVNQN